MFIQCDKLTFRSNYYVKKLPETKRECEISQQIQQGFNPKTVLKYLKTNNKTGRGFRRYVNISNIKDIDAVLKVPIQKYENDLQNNTVDDLFRLQHNRLLFSITFE